MKYQIRRVPWSAEADCKWVVTQLGDTSPVKIGTIEESHLGISAFVEVEIETHRATPYHTTEWMTSEALYIGMLAVQGYIKNKTPPWRNDLGQI